MSENILELFRPIKNLIFDVDGVLATEHLLVTEEGHLLRQMNSKDGFALKTALDKGYTIIIITGGASMGVAKRLWGLGIEQVHYGIHNKQSKYNELQQQFNLKKEETLYMGDDMVDFEVMQLVGLPCCPANAVSEIQQISKYISPFNGGYGCVRDVIEKVLKLNNQWY